MRIWSGIAKLAKLSIRSSYEGHLARIKAAWALISVAERKILKKYFYNYGRCTKAIKW